MASKLTASARYTSHLSPDQLKASLHTAVEPLEGGFKLMSKLSGGGIVVRALRSPETERHWFGKLDQDRFKMAMVVRDKTATPYQPILRGQVSAHGHGSTIELELATHPNARMFSAFFTLGGVLLATASLLAISKSPGIGATGLALAAVFLAFPALRARISFNNACGLALAAFEEHFEVERQPAD